MLVLFSASLVERVRIGDATGVNTLVSMGDTCFLSRMNELQTIVFKVYIIPNILAKSSSVCWTKASLDSPPPTAPYKSSWNRTDTLKPNGGSKGRGSALTD